MSQFEAYIHQNFQLARTMDNYTSPLFPGRSEARFGATPDEADFFAGGESLPMMPRASAPRQPR